MNRNLARIVLLSAGLIWGIGFIINKSVMNNGWDDSQLLFVRFFTASIAIFLIFIKRIIKTDKDTIKKGLFLGLFLFFAFFFQTMGLEKTSASNNALITAGYIIFLPVIVYIMEKRRIGRQALVASLVTFVGIVIISIDFNDMTSINLGDVYTFIGAIIWGFHIYWLGKYAKEKDPVVLMAFQLLVVSVLAFIVMMIQGGFPEVEFNNWNSLKLLVGAVAIGFFASFVAFTFQSIGQKYANETEAAILISTESVFGPILAIYFLGDELSVKLVLGIVFVFVGVILSEIDILQLIRNRKQKT